MDKLRDEVIQAQKIRADLIKWKLVLVAALGASGLGLGRSNTENGLSRESWYILLALIPLVCTYVDIAARHLNIRMLVIGDFMKTYAKTHPAESSVLCAYELHCEGLHKKGIFELENSILTYSSAFLSILVIVAALYLLYQPAQPVLNLAQPVPILLVVSGLLGLLSAYFVDVLYKGRLRLLTGGQNVSESSAAVPVNP